MGNQVKGVEFVTDYGWELMARRVERRNLKERGQSLSWVSIMQSAQRHIVELVEGGRLVKGDWRQTMREAT